MNQARVKMRELNNSISRLGEGSTVCNERRPKFATHLTLNAARVEKQLAEHAQTF